MYTHSEMFRLLDFFSFGNNSYNSPIPFKLNTKNVKLCVCLKLKGFIIN